MIRLAIQSKGRLNEDSVDLLSQSGIEVEQSRRRLLSHSTDFPLEVLYLRDDDIPSAVAHGAADIGIVGLNEVEEKMMKVVIAHRLGFGACRLSLAIPKGETYSSLDYFNGRRVATSYPVILNRYFEDKGITADIHEISGSVEIAPTVGLADAIFDIVSSGSTLISNGLKEVEVVLHSEAVLIASPDLASDKRALLDQLIFRFQAVERSVGKKYLLMNLPSHRVAAATALIPGVKSPTVLPLAQEGWSSVHVVVDQKELWTKIEALKAIGAEDILVLSLEKMIL
ncbi:MAG: ATP phosphoribosyltransferase [Mucinivorans sp.]